MPRSVYDDMAPCGKYCDCCTSVDGQGMLRRHNVPIPFSRKSQPNAERKDDRIFMREVSQAGAAALPYPLPADEIITPPCYPKPWYPRNKSVVDLENINSYKFYDKVTKPRPRGPSPLMQQSHESS